MNPSVSRTVIVGAFAGLFALGAGPPQAAGQGEYRQVDEETAPVRPLPSPSTVSGSTSGIQGNCCIVSFSALATSAARWSGLAVLRSCSSAAASLGRQAVARARELGLEG